MEAEWRCTESRLKEKVGLGARGTQVPTKEPGFSSADTPPKNKQPLQHGQISCVHMCCVKAETQKITEKAHTQDAWKSTVWKWHVSFQILHHQQIHGWLPWLRTPPTPYPTPYPRLQAQSEYPKTIKANSANNLTSNIWIIIWAHI